MKRYKRRRDEGGWGGGGVGGGGVGGLGGGQYPSPRRK